MPQKTKSNPKKLIFAGLTWEGPLPEYYFSLLKVMANKGYEIIIILESDIPDYLELPPNITLLSWPSRTGNYIKDALFLAQLIRQENPNTLIINFGSIKKFLLTGWLLKVKNRVVWLHTTLKQNELNFDKAKWKFQFNYRISQLAYKFANRIIANSEGTLKDYQKHFSAHQPITALPFLIHDPQKRYSNNIQEQTGFYITLVGRMVTSKDHFVAIRALKRLIPHFPELQLKFLGKGPLEEDLIVYAKEKGVRESCNFLGHQNHATVFSVMKYSQANLCTSIDEAFGLVNIQALGMGVPVIGTNVGGIKDIVKDGWNGFLIEVGDEKALAGKILDLLNDKKLHQSIAKQARHDFELYYLLDEEKLNKQCEQIEAMLEAKVIPA